ncbi:MAG: N-acetylglucosaminyldiphosphoundecaprenol [Candidatus Saganbacteria bacterium]|uniref:N-acetylglucosaminyldiphosphoundecaprenol n=1 Tax=Candidatus Saganbacteria bacterium TaxID=2575572 RepID=A0A833L126_UNCSA|nr:MAG: N-acetylglucosaminyldiphosphoundecaprenol [Candidatus Saganbacteria bacterium]
MNNVELAGIKIDNITIDEAAVKIEEFIKKGNPRLVVTPNPEIIVAAQEDEELRNIMNNAHLRAPDGISMVVVSKILNTPLKERVTGIDLLLKLTELSAKKNWRLFFLGGGEGVAEAAAKALKTKFNNIQIVGFHHGYFSDSKQVISEIRNCHPDILFAGLGMGKQEKWLAENLNKLNVPVSVAVGGSFDVVSGIKKRAPKWAQDLYVEWLYRLLTEPQRWKRQLALPKFLWLTLFKNVIINRKHRDIGEK